MTGDDSTIASSRLFGSPVRTARHVLGVGIMMRIKLPSYKGDIPLNTLQTKQHKHGMGYVDVYCRGSSGTVSKLCAWRT